MPDDAARDRQARVDALLEDNIRTELHAQNAVADLGLSQQAITRLARGIAAEVLYAFSVDWSPSWVKPGQVHTWEESGDFFGRCPVCLLDSPPTDNSEAAAAWTATHRAAHRPAQTPESTEPGK
jgi:hypothetical protein